MLHDFEDTVQQVRTSRTYLIRQIYTLLSLYEKGSTQNQTTYLPYTLFYVTGQLKLRKTPTWLDTNTGSCEGYSTVGPEAREHPRLSSPVTKKLTPREPDCTVKQYQ